MIRPRWPWPHRDRAGVAIAAAHLERTRRDWAAVDQLVRELTRRAEENHFAAGMRQALRREDRP